MWEKNEGTIECDKSTITYDIGTAQFENGIIKCEKKNMSTTECGKSMVKCDVSTAQCDNGTIKCEEERKKENHRMWQKYSCM